MNEPTLFDARERGHVAAGLAADRAERVDPGWKLDALQVLREYATRHQEFLIEHVRIAVPSDADPRALGHIAKRAQRLGWIEPHGYAPAISSNGTPKTLWRSTLCSHPYSSASPQPPRHSP